MKRPNAALGWTSFLILSGVFLLLKNLKILDPWGEVAWGGAFALAGFAFLIAFAIQRNRSWRAIPGFTLLSIGAIVLLTWRGVDLGNWIGPLVLFGVALGFWAMLAVQRDAWWAVIPAGALSVVGVLIGFWDRLAPLQRNSALFIGLGLVFALLYVMRLDENDNRWAALPAAALVLFGLVTLFGGTEATRAGIWLWWPVLLIVGGIVGLALALGIRRRPAPVAPIPESYETIEPAKGTSAIGELPEAPLADSAPVKSSTEPTDIYALLGQQPAPDEPETSEPPAPTS